MGSYNDSCSFYKVVLDGRWGRDDSDMAEDRAVGMEIGQNIEILTCESGNSEMLREGSPQGEVCRMWRA